MEAVKERFLRFFSKYLDDLLVISGILLLSLAGFLLHAAVGFGILGTGCIAYGVLVGKAGDAVDRTKRDKQG